MSTIFRQGDTTMFQMTLSEPLEKNTKLKIGLYTTMGKPLYETVWPDDNDIQRLDSKHFTLRLEHEVTKKFIGTTVLRAAVYAKDKSLVNTGENQILMSWAEEPITRILK